MTPEAQAFVVFSLGMLVLMGIGMNMALALVLTGAAMAWVLNFWDTQLLAQNLVALSLIHILQRGRCRCGLCRVARGGPA